MDFDVSAVEGLLNGLPQDGTPAEYVTWFANMLKAVFEIIMNLFKSFGNKDDGETPSGD